ncbi:RNA polymerase sigma factor RpoD/SigA [Archangium sp.]|uniref:sigma-70 family RNA polymerase sigma factor n=1 Tax=Archangium sp. TaxID=1872627 RepID=UPI00389B1242
MAIGRKKTGGTGSRTRAKRPAAAPPPEDAEAVEAESAEPEPDAVEPAPEELEEVEAEVEEVPGPPRAALVNAGETGLARADPLQAYMAEVTRHPLLTREEEVALARRLRDTGDVQAAYRLVAANLRLVVKLAHEYHRNPMALLDLVQEGNIGLMQAVKKYDPERGVKLSSYAAWWIRAYILRYIMDNWKMVKLGTTEAQRKLFFKLRQEQDKLMAQGFEVTPKMLAERLNVTEQDVVEMDQRLGHDEMSLDAPVGGDDSGATRMDRFLPSASVGAEERLGNEQLKALFREKLQEFARSLEGKERYIFENRLISDEPLTLQDIGDKYGVSRERARQIEAGLINRMREYMREHIPDFDLVAVPKG